MTNFRFSNNSAFLINRKGIILFIAFLALNLFSVAGQAQKAVKEPLFSESKPLDLGSLTSTSFLPVKEAYQPDAWFEEQDLIIQWNIAPEYYLYRDRTFFSGVNLGEEGAVFEQGTLILDEFFQKEMVVYRHSTQMRMPNFAAENPGTSLLTIEAQGCADAGLCYPPTDFWFEIDAEQRSTLYAKQMPEFLNISSANTLVQSEEISNLFLAVIFAFVGGLILNLMPCVFPILAIKALKISNASESMSNRIKEAGAYTAGILTTVLLIAGIMLAIRAGGAQIGWGFQLQSPAVILALTSLFFIIGLSFSGWIEWGARFAGVGQRLTEDGKPLQSFFTGVLAMIVASPCSAPFMAAALGYAISQPASISLPVFASLGLGMATPLMLLYLLPGFASLLPKPGTWMATLKQFLAFPMYLTCIWLIWVFTAQVGATGAAFAMTGLCILAMTIWLYGKSETTPSRIVAFASLVVAALLMFGSLEQTPAKRSDQSFTLAELDQQVGGAQPIFLDVTADWCISCQFNEQRVLHSPDIQKLFEQQKVIYLVADWTNANPEISQLLDRYQRVGIPLYLYFPPNRQVPVLLPQILSKRIVRQLFRQP